MRPLLVSAFGDIFVEIESGGILLVDTLELSCERVAENQTELSALFDDQEWASERLLCETLLLARERGITRRPEQVFAVAPHPAFSGSIRVEQLSATDLLVWHGICVQMRL